MISIKEGFKKTIYMWALGMGLQLQEGHNQSSFLQTPPSAEEIDAEALQEQQNISPVESLKSLPGMVVLGSEVTTYSGSLFLRGANSDQTLFIWNDFRADNFTAPAGATDPFSFGKEFSNRIRVLKGPQSLLYGTQALGGVILIDDDPDLDSTVEVAAGSLQTSQGLGEIRWRGGKMQVAAGGSAFATEGISSYKAVAPRGSGGILERDGRQKSSASLIASWSLPSDDQLQVMVNGLHENLSDDAPPLDDLNAASENRALQWKLRYKVNWSDFLESSFLLTHQQTDRENKNPADIFSTTYYLDQSRGQRETFLNRNRFQFLKSLWQIGTEFSQEQGDFFSNSDFSPQGSSFKPRRQDQSLYVVNDWNFSRSDFSWGVRGHCQDAKNCAGVYQLSYQWHWPDDQRSLYAIVSSGLKRPTLYQLYSLYGDSLLRPETSRAFELGLVQRWDTRQTLKVSAFETQFADLIDYDFALSKYKNLNRARTRGIELLHQYNMVFWDSQLSLAQIYARDEQSQTFLLRRPEWQASWNLGYDFTENFRIGNELMYVSTREDSVGGARVMLLPVTLWNVVFTHKVFWGQYFLRVNNAGNVFYEEIHNYQTPGRFVWVGAKVGF